MKSNKSKNSINESLASADPSPVTRKNNRKGLPPLNRIPTMKSRQSKIGDETLSMLSKQFNVKKFGRKQSTKKFLGDDTLSQLER